VLTGPDRSTRTACSVVMVRFLPPGGLVRGVEVPSGTF
jgi:hypothetical protein